MKVERIEELLESQPPDEPPYRGELFLGPRLVRVTWFEPRGRRPVATALNSGAVIAVLIGLVVVALAIGPSAARPTIRPSPSTTASVTPHASPPLGVIPWIAATPTPSPTPEPTPDP